MSPIKNKLNLAGYFSYRVFENQGKLTNHYKEYKQNFARNSKLKLLDISTYQSIYPVFVN